MITTIRLNEIPLSASVSELAVIRMLLDAKLGDNLPEAALDHLYQALLRVDEAILQLSPSLIPYGEVVANA